MKFKIAQVGKHYWEEPIISGENGSGTIFFSGCSMKCVYCQNYEISHGAKGLFVDEEQLIKLMLFLQEQGAHNINLVTPSHYAINIAKTLDQIKGRELHIPVVYNTSCYDTVENLKRLEDLIDIYLPDMKYADNILGKKYSKVPDYIDVALKALTEMRRQQPKDIIKSGIMQRGVLVRHLVLPNHIENTKNVLRILEKIDKSFYISLMAQFFPTKNCLAYSDINRRLTNEEYQQAIDFFLNTSLTNGFSQDPESATEDYVPVFNLVELKNLLISLPRL